MWSYYSGKIQKVGDAEFTELLGHPIPSGAWSGQIGLNDTVCQMYYAKSRLARMLYRLLTYIKEKKERKGEPDLNMLFIYYIPFRAIAKMTGGRVSMEMAEGIVTMVNGHFIKGLRQVIKGAITNRRENKRFQAAIRDRR